MQNRFQRRRFFQYCAVFGSSLWVASSCTAPSSRKLEDWLSPPDLDAAGEQAQDFVTYGIPADWANYGEVIETFAQTYDFDLKHTDTDMASLTQIMKLDAEKNNPYAICGDIGLLYAAVAEQQGVTAPYLPPQAVALPPGLKSNQGGWVATYTGVPALVVNTDVIVNVPRTWDDLLKPEYQGKVSSINPVRAGNSATAFLAWAYAYGGNEDDMGPAIAFAKQLLPQFSATPANVQTLEKGEVPIQINYDFICNHAVATLKAKNIGAETVIPGISIYAPSALLVNKYNTRKMDIAKLFMDYVLSDEAQITFAKFGARPIRYVLGDLEIPAAAREQWLPDEHYRQVQQIQDWINVDAERIGQIWTDEVLGG